jgi:hypothetical protein
MVRFEEKSFRALLFHLHLLKSSRVRSLNLVGLQNPEIRSGKVWRYRFLKTLQVQIAHYLEVCELYVFSGSINI